MINLTYNDLYTGEGLTNLHQAFLQTNPPDDLLARAIALQSFIEAAFRQTYHDSIDDQVLFQKVRREFVQRYALVRFEYDPTPRPVIHDLKSWAERVWQRFQAGEKLEEEAQYAVWAANQSQPHPLFVKPKPREWDVTLPPAIGKRIDFTLYEPGLSQDEAYKEAFYCVGCHKKEKDSCSTGMPGTNPLGVSRQGCPLGQKISQMALLSQQGHWLAALAVAMIDNPLIAATGHRICTACMDACIYQKQDAVNIPGLESYLLQSLYQKPYGFEVYRLLAWWNPLAPQPLPSEPSNKNVLVVGMGPAGMMAAHGLLRLGHAVYAVDGLHIRDLPADLLEPQLLEFLPPKDNAVWKKDGFGGVMSYGITARWDASHLLVLRLLLSRHPRFALKGNVRLGSTLTLSDARHAGFDHVALCMGAGSPARPPAELMHGARFAHDFLMALHLHQKPPKVVFPCVVIGGGLTAVDTATEVLVSLRQQYGADLPAHAVTLIYRKPLGQSPAWKVNAIEVKAAAEEGVHIIDDAVPVATVCDDKGVAIGVNVRMPRGDERIIPAHTVLLATGTSPHTLEELGLPNPKMLGQYEFLIEPDVSVLGDVHPYYRGSVVDAMASAKHALNAIHQALNKPNSVPCDVAHLWHDLSVRWLEPAAIGDKLWLLTVRAPAMARAFQPGQFFRVSVDGHLPMALTGAWVESDCISMMMFETPFTKPLLHALQTGQAAGLMGPTGAPTFLPSHTSVQLIGSGFGHGALLAIAQGLKNNQCDITYLGHDDGSYQQWRSRIEASVNKCVWFNETWPEMDPDAYTLIIGPPPFLNALKQRSLPKQAFACLVSPMQCMMKGMCGRCITRVGNHYVWACSEQDQKFCKN